MSMGVKKILTCGAKGGGVEGGREEKLEVVCVSYSSSFETFFKSKNTRDKKI